MSRVLPLLSCVLLLLYAKSCGSSQPASLSVHALHHPHQPPARGGSVAQACYPGRPHSALIISPQPQPSTADVGLSSLKSLRSKVTHIHMHTDARTHTGKHTHIHMNTHTHTHAHK